MTLLAPAVQVALMLVVWTACILDLRSRRIPNWLTAGGVLLGFGLNALLYGRTGLWLSLQGLGFALAVYVPLFALRAMGASDAKLMAAAGSLVGPWNWLGLFLITCLLNGAIAVILILTRKRFRKTVSNVILILKEMAHFRPPHRAKPELEATHASAVTMPHGAVIAFAATVFLALNR